MKILAYEKVRGENTLRRHKEMDRTWFRYDIKAEAIIRQGI